MKEKFTILMATNDQEKFQVASRFWSHSMADMPINFMPIVNPSNLPEAYNAALGRVMTEYVIVSHHDAFPLQAEGYVIGHKLAKHMEDVDVAGFVGSSHLSTPLWCGGGPARNYGVVCTPSEAKIWANIWGMPAKRVLGMRTLDGFCLIFKTEVLRKIGFDPQFAWHFYDHDVVSSALEAGYTTACLNDVFMTHLSAGRFDSEWARTTPKFAAKWRGRCDFYDPSIVMNPVIIKAEHCTTLLMRLQEMVAMVPDEVSALA